MELDLDPATIDALAAEADERGFESPEAYAGWLLEHRESILRPPGEQLQARLERVEGQLERLRHTLEDGVATEITVESGPSDRSEPQSETEWFDEGRSADETTSAVSGEFDDEPAEDTATTDAGVSEFAYSDELDPPPEDDAGESPVEDDPEAAADDDEIAEALADIELEDEEQAADADEEDDADDEQ